MPPVMEVGLIDLCVVLNMFYFYCKWYHRVYALSKISLWLCGRAELTAEGEVESEKGRERRKKMVLSSNTAVFVHLEKAAGLQDGPSRRL